MGREDGASRDLQRIRCPPDLSGDSSAQKPFFLVYSGTGWRAG